MNDFPPPPAPYYCQIPSLASIVKLPPPDSQAEGETFYGNFAPEEEEQITGLIQELVTTLAENGKISLLFKRGHLHNLGVALKKVHPLKFLSTVFADPHLKLCMGEIFDDRFKRTGFLEGENHDGISHSLTQEANRGKLEPYLNDFAQKVNIPVEAIRPFIKNSDWEGLILFLIHS